MEQTKKPTRKNAKATPGDVLPAASDDPVTVDPAPASTAGRVLARGAMGYVLIDGIGWVYNPDA